ncbi:MAG: ATP synthase F1 subunit gamma [Patescibacteria group bacterium]
MAKTKEIKSRIKSVSNTKKITRAMEMVSAAKMRKAIEAVLRTRTYANLSWETVLNLSQALRNGNGGYVHPLLAKRENIRKIGVVLFTSNRGLCGGFNAAVINKIQKYVENSGGAEVDFFLVGKKGVAIHKNYGYNIVAEFSKLDLSSEVKEIIPVANMAMNDFLSGKYDKIFAAYTDFASASRQIPRVKQLLPVDVGAEDGHLGIVGEDTRVGITKEFIEDKEEKHISGSEYTFEPSPKEVLDAMIPRLIEVQLFQALLESNASEHSARMMTMHQATDAASEMVKELTLFYNKARQAAITAEIAEIAAGAEALK